MVVVAAIWCPELGEFGDAAVQAAGELLADGQPVGGWVPGAGQRASALAGWALGG
jgi:hypothetical protein